MPREMTPLPGIDPPPPVPNLSADQKRTQRRQELLDAGIHPRTGLPLAENGETCGTCLHHFVRHVGSDFHKCDLTPPTRGPATDVRVSWPACTGWEAA